MRNNITEIIMAILALPIVIYSISIDDWTLTVILWVLAWTLANSIKLNRLNELVQQLLEKQK